MINAAIKEKIVEKLLSIEEEHQIKILLAVESGSRAWGFDSRNSDYDVRFVYTHTLDWYLSIEPRRDVIEYPLDDLLDFSGWDIRKALYLLKKSNPPLLEWIKSPIVYRQNPDFKQSLETLEKKYFSPKGCLYHYFHMAEGNYREYLKKDIVRVKKYFYVLRPLLACKWIEKNNTPPPIEFEKLLKTQVTDQQLMSEIDHLLQRKISGEELDQGPAIKILNDFIEQEIDYYSKYAKQIKKSPNLDVSLLNELFKEIIGI